MNDLKQQLAPIAADAWREIEQEAKSTLETQLAGRRLTTIAGPHGWSYSGIGTGRLSEAKEEREGVTARARQLQPLIELRAEFALERDQLDLVARGAADPDLDPLREAARALAISENTLVFEGSALSASPGICNGAEAAEGLGVDTDLPAQDVYPDAVSRAIAALRARGVSGPYALALGPQTYHQLASTTATGGYPVIRHVERLLDQPLIWAPGLDGMLLTSQRGGDFELHLGRDASIGYLAHDERMVRLYLEESATFRLLGPEAAVYLPGGAP